MLKVQMVPVYTLWLVRAITWLNYLVRWVAEMYGVVLGVPSLVKSISLGYFKITVKSVILRQFPPVVDSCKY